MKLDELVKLLDAKVFTPTLYNGNKEVEYAFGSDLMSDALMVLRTAPDVFFEKGMLLTGLVTTQSIRTAEMLEFGVVVLVRGKIPNANVLKAALELNIVVIGTKYSMFSASGRLYQKSIKGISEVSETVSI